MLMPSVIMPSDIILSTKNKFILLYVVMPSVVTLSVIMLSVVIPNVIMLNVAAPCTELNKHSSFQLFLSADS
jgi:hypothetical protein